MTDEKDLIRTKGKINYINETTDQKGKKYRITLEGDEKMYSGFGSCPGKMGDEIEFSYVIVDTETNRYHNIKRLEGVQMTHPEPTVEDFQMTKDIQIRIAIADLINTAIKVCMHYNYESKEWFPTVERILKMAKLWEIYDQLNKGENGDTPKTGG